MFQQRNVALIICILPCVTQFRYEKLGTLFVSKSEESINGVTHKLGRHCFDVIFSRSSHNLLTGSLGGRELFSGQCDRLKKGQTKSK